MRPAMLVVASAALAVALVVTPPLRAQAEETHAGNVESPQAARAALASFDKAVKAFNGKDYEKARKELGICLGHQPNNSDAHLLLAKTLYAVKDYAAALAEVEAPPSRPLMPGRLRPRCGRRVGAPSCSVVGERRTSRSGRSTCRCRGRSRTRSAAC